MTRFEGILDAVPDALVGVDQSGVIRFVNRSTELLFGYERAALVGSPIEMLVPESLRQVHSVHREDYDKNPEARIMGVGLEPMGRRADGTLFPVEINLSHIDAAYGRLVIAAVRDVTERHREVRELSRLSRLSAMIEFSQEAILSTTLDGTITTWNPAAEKLFGYPSGEILGQSATILSPGDRTHESKTVLEKITAGESVVDLDTFRVRKDGTVFPASVTVSPIRDADGAVVGASAIPRDMTGQKEAFEAAQRMAAIVENSGDAIIGATLEGFVTTWNAAAERMFDYSPDEIVGMPIGSTNPPDRTGESQAIIAKVTAGEPVENFETIRVRKDGSVFPVSVTVSPIRDAGGAIVGVSAIARDLTEQQKTAGAARSMIESSLDSLVAISPEGMITDVNEATVKVTGIPREELIGTAFSDCFSEPEKANRIYQLVFAEGMAVDYPLTMRHRDGTLTEVLYNASVYRDTGGSVLGIFAAARDVTKQKQAFESARRMAAEKR